MDWKDIADVVGKAAPVVGSVLGGPAGGAIGGLIASALGVEATPEAVQQAVAKDPEALLKIKRLELEHRRELEAMQADLEKARLADRQDARSRDIAIQEARGANWRADVLAIGALLGLVALIYTLLWVQIPDGPARDVLLMLSGALVAVVKDVFAFEFGSSRGSKNKERALTSALEKRGG